MAPVAWLDLLAALLNLYQSITCGNESQCVIEMVRENPLEHRLRCVAAAQPNNGWGRSETTDQVNEIKHLAPKSKHLLELEQHLLIQGPGEEQSLARLLSMA